ncbi:hypothetical protein AB9P05_18770 [Roseivirga sp. BDSF3-8]|uniref:hypothetical protein n=1 Tax=Roseivirga sp. BDSF3-8 TaxID=3241598 RepID=UPI003531E3C7
MVRISGFLLFLFIFTSVQFSAFGQAESAAHAEETNPADTTRTVALQDSVQQHSLVEADSIIRADIAEGKARVDSLQNALGALTDSLPDTQSLTKPVDDANREIAESHQTVQGAVDRAREEAQQVVDNTTEAVNGKLEGARENVGGVQQKAQGAMSQGVDAAGIDGGQLPGTPDLPNTEVSGLEVPGMEIPGMEIPGTEVPGVEISGADIPSTGAAGGDLGLTEKPEALDQLGETQQKIAEVSDEAQQIQSAVDSMSVEKAAEYGEEKLKDTQYYKALEEQAGQNIDVIPTEEGLREQGKQQVVSQAKNYFAGKEDKIREAQALLGKYKKKYHSLNSIKDVPLNRNPLADTPFVKRIVVGAYLQLLKDPWGGDINPVIGYRIYPKWEAGIGGTYRILFDVPDDYKFAEDAKVYGFRAYSSYEIADILAFHAELEYINSLVVYPSLTGEPPSPERRWVPGLPVGIRKKFDLGSKFQMRGVILYNLLHDYKSPYGSDFHIRLGFFFR